MTARYRLYALQADGWHQSPPVTDPHELIAAWQANVIGTTYAIGAESSLVQGYALQYVDGDGLQWLACSDRSPFRPTKVVGA
jgi:hypothetical protein